MPKNDVLSQVSASAGRRTQPKNNLRGHSKPQTLHAAHQHSGRSGNKEVLSVFRYEKYSFRGRQLPAHAILGHYEVRGDLRDVHDVHQRRHVQERLREFTNFFRKGGFRPDSVRRSASDRSWAWSTGRRSRSAGSTGMSSRNAA